MDDLVQRLRELAARKWRPKWETPLALAIIVGVCIAVPTLVIYLIEVCK